jgi:RNA polymerase sigma-70 factor, ECF subfamily
MAYRIGPGRRGKLINFITALKGKMEWSNSEVVAEPDKESDQFEFVFKTHFKGLNAYAYTILHSVTQAEEIVQEVFYKLWEKRTQLDIQSSLKAYLYRSVHNESLNHLKHQKVIAEHKRYTMQTQKEYDEENDPGIRLGTRDLEDKIRLALNELPEQCRTIFQLSRFESMKYHEIAGQLGLSVKTVENQMGKALKRLRLKLAEYLPFFLFFFHLLKFLP